MDSPLGRTRQVKQILIQEHTMPVYECLTTYGSLSPEQRRGAFIAIGAAAKLGLKPTTLSSRIKKMKLQSSRSVIERAVIISKGASTLS